MYTLLPVISQRHAVIVKTLILNEVHIMLRIVKRMWHVIWLN